jgi:hypothetical protein
LTGNSSLEKIFTGDDPIVLRRDTGEKTLASL